MCVRDPQHPHPASPSPPPRDVMRTLSGRHQKEVKTVAYRMANEQEALNEEHRHHSKSKHERRHHSKSRCPPAPERVWRKAGQRLDEIEMHGTSWNPTWTFPNSPPLLLLRTKNKGGRPWLKQTLLQWQKCEDPGGGAGEEDETNDKKSLITLIRKQTLTLT